MFGLTPPVLRIRSDLGIEGEEAKKKPRNPVKDYAALSVRID
jgi:hypothetical protein